MARAEVTVPGILKEFDRSGNVPQNMLPVEDIRNAGDEDLSKPVRGAFEAILGARVARPAIDQLRVNITANPRSAYYMVPLAQIEREGSHQARSDILKDKTAYVLREYHKAIRTSLEGELDENARRRQPQRVAVAYDHLSPTTNPDNIGAAVDTLDIALTNLLGIATYDYPTVLGTEPTARQMIDLMANSYSSFVHLLAARHVETPTVFDKFSDTLTMGKDFEIDISGEKHQIKIINPGQYIKLEEDLKKSGKIKSATIHCPFSISSAFTEPYLDSDQDPVEGNPLRFTFESLTREFIGA